MLLLLALLLGGTPSPEPLRVGMEVRHPPWAFVPGRSYAAVDPRQAPALSPVEERALVGFDVDVARLLAGKLGRPLRLVPWAWYALEDGLLARQFDVAISAWTPALDTRAEIRASRPYAQWGLLVVTSASDVKTFADLERRRVAYVEDPVVERALVAMSQSLGEGDRGQFEPRDLQQPMVDDVRMGRVDAIIVDSLLARWLVQRDPRLRVVGEPLNRLGYHAATRRADAALGDAVDAALKASAAALAELQKQWEGGGSHGPSPVASAPAAK